MMRRGELDKKNFISKLNKHLCVICAVGILPLLISSSNVFAGVGQELKFQCPQAYQGIKPDLLPTYWEATDQGKGIHARQSLVQGKYIMCIYRESNGKPIGNVRRLIPEGYRCITGGKGVFQCDRKK